MPSIIVSNVSLNYPLFGGQNPDPNAGKGNCAEEDGKSDKSANHAGASVLEQPGANRYVKALNNICFALNPGDRLGIVGRNGSGKSTLLRVLAGIYEPTSGSVFVDGRVAPLFSVGLGVRRDATGRRNIILRGLINGLSYAEAEAKVDEVIEYSELGPYIDMPVRTYSSGMAMRLSFASATVFSPEILLLDEWIGAGDDHFRKKVAKRMTSLVEGAGITVLASHRRPLLKQVCTHGLWLDGGNQLAFGTIDEVLSELQAVS